MGDASCRQAPLALKTEQAWMGLKAVILVIRVMICVIINRNWSELLVVLTEVRLGGGVMQGERIRDLRSAKSCCAYISNHSSQVVLFLDAFLATAHEITVRWDPADEARKNMQKFIDWVDEERLVSLALMVDGAHETTAVRRLFEGNYDLTTIAQKLGDSIHRLDVLFLQRKVLEATNSYTSYMIHNLRRKTRLLKTSDGLKGMAGGWSVPDELLDRAFNRMAGWVHRFVRGIEAEFPKWEILQARDSNDDNNNNITPNIMIVFVEPQNTSNLLNV